MQPPEEQQRLDSNQYITNKWPKIFPILVTILAFLVVGYMVIGAFQHLGQIIAPVFVPLLISLAMAYLLEPLVEKLESYRLPRSNATIMALLLTSFLLLLLLFVFLPQFWAQLSDVIARLPTAAKSVAAWIRPKLDSLHNRNPMVFEKISAKLTEFTQDPSSVTEPVVDFIKGSLLQLGSVTASVLNLILIPLFAYYILVDFRHLTEMLYQTVPPRNRSTVADLFNQVDAVLRNFVRGQLLVCSAMATLYVIAFFFLDVPMWFALGVLSGFGHLVPYFGTASAGVLVVSFTALNHPEWWRIITVILCYPTVQSIEGFILTPKILGEKLELHPFIVLIGIILGHHLFGILGIVLAAPVMASAKIFIGFLYKRYLKSSFYQRPARVSSQTIPFINVSSGQIVNENSFADFINSNVNDSNSVTINTSTALTVPSDNVNEVKLLENIEETISEVEAKKETKSVDQVAVVEVETNN